MQFLQIQKQRLDDAEDILLPSADHVSIGYFLNVFNIVIDILGLLFF